LKSKYDSKTWATETNAGRRVFNHNFRIKGSDVADWPLVKAVLMHKDKRLVETTFVVRGKDSPDRHLISVNVTELPDWRSAQKHLLEILDHCMRPDIPRGSGDAATVGDVSFVARAPESDVPAAIQFTRGNIAVAVSSVGPVNIDVSAVAAAVDRLLSEPTEKLPSIKKLAKVQAPKSVVIRSKEGSRLVKSLKATGDTWLKVIVPDGELRREDNALVFVSRKHGKKSVQIVSVSA